MELIKVMFMLGLQSKAAMARELNVTRSTVQWWSKTGIPAHRRLQIAQMIRERGLDVPEGLLDPVPAHPPRKAA